MKIMDLQRILQILLFIMPVAVDVTESLGDCFTSEKTYQCHLGSMTPYRLIANKNDSEINYRDCVPKKIWILMRHGTRYPGKKWTAKMMKKLPNLWDAVLKSHSSGERTLSDKDIELFRRWKFNFSDDDIMKLTTEGEKEFVGIAERFQSRFPLVMPEIYNNKTYSFKYTATQRTEESAKNFALGLFGRKQSLNVWYPSPEYRDPILRFYKSCKRWREEVDNNLESYKENEKFAKSSVVHNLLAQVSKRAGFELDYDDVRLIYNICAFETAWYENKKSPWCNLLSLDDFKVFEFVQDLQYYWVDGYGYPLTYEQACITMRNMFDFFELKDEKKVTAYFTHSGALLKMLSYLGIAREEKALRYDSFSHETNRIWRTTLIDSFASNIAFILYDCKTQGPSILLMHQERVVRLEDCPVEMPCPLSTMRKKYPVHECRFDEMCAMRE